MNSAQFDSADNRYRLKSEEMISNGKWKLISQGITSHEAEKDNNNRHDENLPGESYVLVFMVIDNY